MNWCYRSAIPSLAIAMLVFSHPAVSAQDIVGVWTDEAAEFVYEFTDSHGFFFRAGKGGKKDGGTSWNQEAQGDWQTGESICWKGYKNTQQPGNLMVYVQALHCCMIAKRRNGNLVLTKIWEGGYTSFTGVCQERVLKRLKETMK